MLIKTGFNLGILTLGLTLALPGAAQNNQSVENLSCSTELAVIFGNAFQASCTGDLTIKSGSVIEAVESILISAEGNITHLGTLVAPNIRLTANGSTLLSGGFFSGSSEAFPEVIATSYASGNAIISTFQDLVKTPFVDPVYGAVISTQVIAPVLTYIPNVETPSFAPITSSVPEASNYALMFVGLAILMGRISASRKRIEEA